MPKKSYVRTFMDSQHAKGSQKLLKFSRQHFCNIVVTLKKNQLENVCFSSIWNPETTC